MARNKKELLSHEHEKQYQHFLTDTRLTLTLKHHTFKKTPLVCPSGHVLTAITKDDDPHTFVWTTSARNIKTAVRYGIINPQALTAKVIATIGRYRLTAYDRVQRGLISNSQLIKIQLLDIFQARFEALQGLERLVNKPNEYNDYALAINGYIQELNNINCQITLQPGLEQISVVRLQTILKQSIQKEIEWAQSWQKELKNKDLIAVNKAQGESSVLEFIKERLLDGLYALQGINQDLTYDRKRSFALTRGVFNDVIEDARKRVEDHEADLNNAILPAHQGIFDDELEALVNYDFAVEGFSSTQERQMLGAISFIEGCDKIQIDSHKIYVTNQYGSEELSIFAATNWRQHRHFNAFAKSTLFFLWNTLKSFFISTRPWEEETWAKPEFHLIGVEWRKHAKPHFSVWRKPYLFCQNMFFALVDFYKGIKEVAIKLSIRLPRILIHDWQSSGDLPLHDEVLRQAENEISQIQSNEQTILGQIKSETEVDTTSFQRGGPLAQPAYPLSSFEQNDVLTAVVRGLGQFSDVFSMPFAKNPLGGLGFTLGYLTGFGVIYLPHLSAALLGPAYVNKFSTMAYSMGNSKFAAAVSGSVAQAQMVASGSEDLLHGPNGATINTAYTVLSDPLLIGTYVLGAYGSGYLLVNGINGHAIPFLSEVLKDDLGDIEELGYPFIGGKFAILLYEGLEVHDIPQSCPQLVFELPDLQSIDLLLRQQVTLIKWLAEHANSLPRLSDDTRFQLSQWIEDIFPKVAAASLKTLIYPPVRHSIAFQVFAIPLMYIPTVFRVMGGLVLSAVAYGLNRPYPLKPLARSWGTLTNLVKRDLSRLPVLGRHVAYVPYNLVATLVKMTVDVITLFVARVGAWLNHPVSYAMHEVYARVHSAVSRWKAALYPTRILEDATPAHPLHTLFSYDRLLNKLGASGGKSSSLSSSVRWRETSHGPLFKGDVATVKPETSLPLPPPPGQSVPRG